MMLGRLWSRTAKNVQTKNLFNPLNLLRKIDFLAETEQLENEQGVAT